MKRIFLLLMSILFFCFVNAQEKIPLGKGSALYPSTIKKYKNYFSVWTEVFLSTPQYNQEKEQYYTNSKVRWLIDCNEMKMVLFSKYDYAEDGSLVHSFDTIELIAELLFDHNKPVIPGSNGWNIIEETCKRKE